MITVVAYNIPSHHHHQSTPVFHYSGRRYEYNDHCCIEMLQSCRKLCRLVIIMLWIGKNTLAISCTVIEDLICNHSTYFLLIEVISSNFWGAYYPVQESQIISKKLITLPVLQSQILSLSLHLFSYLTTWEISLLANHAAWMLNLG